MNSQPLIETKNLTKKYGEKVVVDKLNLSIAEGERFGFLGPNGAGKTTTILMLLGLTQPSSGTANIAGFNCTREPLKVKRITGYVPERLGFYEELSAYYNLAYTARLNGLPEAQVSKRVTSALEEVGLIKTAEQQVGQFSAGMKQRLGIADILVKEPKLAILDEPTSGIDPKGVHQLLELIDKIAKERNMTIIMCSHQLKQVQQICTRVGIMQKGKIVVEGGVEDLGRQAFSGGKFRIEVKLTEITSAVIEAIRKIAGVVNVERSEDTLVVTAQTDLRPQIAKAVVDSNGLLVQMNIQSYALEDIYLKYSEGQ
ncbi:MAG: ABC transporter ATP-binding protein [Dehalococcoidales bacterium]|nr:ABC transporter ATP-binding protein [Dehalococcoidales bacterium]